MNDYTIMLSNAINRIDRTEANECKVTEENLEMLVVCGSEFLTSKRSVRAELELDKWIKVTWITVNLHD